MHICMCPYIYACMHEYLCALVCLVTNITLKIQGLLYEERIDKAFRDRCFLKDAQLNSLMKKL